MEEQPQGPFDKILESEPRQQRDRVAIGMVGAAIALGLVLLVLVLPPVSILDSDGDGALTSGDGDRQVATVLGDDLPEPPEGYTAVSALQEYSGKEDILALTVPLVSPVAEDTQLVLFTYADGEWQELGEGSVAIEGTHASIDLKTLPENLAVFTTGGAQARIVMGTLPLGAQLDPNATNALTALNPAGYVPAADGSVAGVLQVPADAPGAVVPSVRATAPAEIDAVNAILASEELAATHAQALLAIARGDDFDGLDIDYRAIDPTLGESFVSLARTLSAGLHAEQRTLTLTLPLPARDGDAWDTLGYDWAELAALADTIKLAPEPDRSMYFTRTEAALEYLVPIVGSGKLVLGVGPLSYEQSVDGVRTMPLTAALALASTPALEVDGPVVPDASIRVVGENIAPDMGATGLKWDDTSRSLTFSYTGAGGSRTLWVSNRFSEAFKLDLAARYQLGGVYVESVGRGAADADIWPAVREYAQTGAVVLAKPNGELLQPQWTASAGSFDSETGAAVTWHAPSEAGNQTLTLIVSDGVVRMGQELQVSVQPAAGARAR